jgi:hypothetical protein
VYAQQLEEHRLQQEREAREARAQQEQAQVPASPPAAEDAVREEAVQAMPVRETPRAEPPREEAPRIDPKELLASAGLQMVETDAAKTQAFAPEPEAVALGRPRRSRAPQAVAEEPELVQVETRK